MNEGHSKFQLHINRLLKIIHSLQHDFAIRKIYAKQTDDFINMLLRENRTTKEELAKFFKKRNIVK